MTEENFFLYVAYINNELSPEQDAEFIELLNNNPGMMQEFEDELALRKNIHKEAVQEYLTEENPAGFEAANQHLQNVQKLLEEEKQEKENTPVINFYTKYKYALTAAACLVLAVAAWLYFKTPKKNENIIVQHDTTIDSLKKKDSLQKIQPVITNEQVDGGRLYAENFTRYEKGIDDPPEADLVYAAYNKKKFDEVINTVKEDYQTMGADDSLATLYVSFYKGLSYLEKNSLLNAESYFNAVINSKEATDVLQDKAKWYLALALLKQNKANAVKDVLNTILKNKSSAYKKKAKSLLDVIDNTR